MISGKNLPSFVTQKPCHRNESAAYKGIFWYTTGPHPTISWGWGSGWRVVDIHIYRGLEYLTDGDNEYSHKNDVLCGGSPVPPLTSQNHHVLIKITSSYPVANFGGDHP